MLIGIDASRSTVGQRTGTENYSLHLLRELLALDVEHHFRLYFNQPPSSDLFPDTVDDRVIPFPRLWTHLRLSWEMLSDAPDLLFVPSHVLPLIHPRRSVVTVHDLGYLYYPEAHTLTQNVYLRWSTRFNAQAASHILADSEATRRDLMSEYQISGNKISVVYPGRDEILAPIDDPAILTAVQARHGLTQPYLLYVGTLHPRKNLVRLVEAFGLLVRPPADDAPPPIANLQLVLAGQKGWLYDEVVTQIRNLDLTEQVHLTGYVPEEDLATLLSGAQAFVYPSLYEGFGIPVLEAMACGTPVICSNVSSLPEVAGDAAIQVDPMDIEALAQALRDVLLDDGLRLKLVERGYRQVRRFSWRRSADETMQVFEDVAKTSRDHT